MYLSRCYGSLLTGREQVRMRSSISIACSFSGIYEDLILGRSLYLTAYSCL
jgi:hypothetical protein